ncbi:uncharacterized protein LAESUDRAFT_654190 [Laetiporus sulphureus 93-53]|uniref:Peptidase A2 domain-containing protein n=1 Tax=Laetiporus sulphureus 93-53 TaxID=1314785 RepID=A0A165E3I4_9APHY|nr:uncharacterized protein LAESUDRAFT_654190 [Laetiporus sulphureus 93-53]KZT06182.1 hypothetical protein LAESUDRAFT_654190 [Laetiporus sulphureus 93-53]
MEQICLTTYMSINGLKALVLFDSGSTTDSISPDFAKVAGIKVHKLENPTVLQLSCMESHSRISFGASIPIVCTDIYVNAVNLNRYDAVLGTPFMHKFGVYLDFEDSAIRLRSQTITALLSREEEAGAHWCKCDSSAPASSTMHMSMATTSSSIAA